MFPAKYELNSYTKIQNIFVELSTFHFWTSNHVSRYVDIRVCAVITCHNTDKLMTITQYGIYDM
jgi:hypothetical protein